MFKTKRADTRQPSYILHLTSYLRQWAHQSPLRELLEAAEGVDVEPCPFHDVLIRDAVHRFITDGTRCRHLMTRADALQIAPLESPANRGTAIMQGAYSVAMADG